MKYVEPTSNLFYSDNNQTFSDRNTMYSLIWYARNIFSKANSNVLEKRLISFVTDTVGQ